MEEDDQLHPVSFYSKKLDKFKKSYSTIEKEALTLVMSLSHFEVYVSSVHGPTILYTDHNPLIYVNRMKNKNRRVLSWSLILQEFDLDIRHVRGRDNVIADALSRRFETEREEKGRGENS